MPAYPRKVSVMVDGKEVFIRLFGDEHYKWAETEDGYTIMQNEQQQWCYAYMDSHQQLTPSRWSIGGSYEGDTQFSAFISDIPRHLVSKSQNSKHTDVPRQQRVKAVVGERRILIILMQYKDKEFIKTRTDYDQLFNQETYQVDGAQGSVFEFFHSASYGQLSLVSDVYGPYTSTKEMGYYGKNSTTNNRGDMHAYNLFEEAITAVAAETDLRQYDGDEDGFIDNVHIIFAGYGEEAGGPANAIWSHEATFYRPYVIQNLKIDHYSCAPELRGNKGEGISRIGPHCHEIGHALGAMDYYDTDYEANGQFSGTGVWDVMASGSWNNDGITPADFNPYVKAYNFGWITPKTLPVGNVTIQPSSYDPNSYYVLKSSEFGDYYMLENRSKDGWGGALPGAGLLVFHIHNELPYAENEINIAAPQMCYVVCASSNSKQPNSQPSSYGDINSKGCPFPGSSGNKTFGQSSTPMAFYWSGEDCKIELNDITLQSEGYITLINKSEDAGYVPPKMISLYTEDFEDTPQISILESVSRQWSVVENPENNTQFLTRPIAHKGINSLQLSAQDQYYPETNAFEFSCKTNNAVGRTRISGYYTSYGLKPKKGNTLKIGYKSLSSNDEEWHFTEVISNKNQIWNQFFVDVTTSDTLFFRIEGIANIGSILALDEIEVEQEADSTDTQVSSIIKNKCQSRIVYDLMGKKQTSLVRGINIIKSEDGKVIKYIKSP